MNILEQIAMRHSAEHASDDGRNNKRAKDSLKEDGILDLAQRRLLNPNLTIKDLADDVSLLVLCDPWLVLVAVAAGKAVHRFFLDLNGLAARFVVAISEQLPWPQVSVVHTVQDL